MQYRLESRGVAIRQGENTVVYDIKMDSLGGVSTTKDRGRLAFAGVRLTYNTDAFGQRVRENDQCRRLPGGSVFSPLSDYEYAFTDTTDNSFTITAHITTTTIAANKLVPINKLDDSTFMRIRCNIQKADEDAGIAISGADITSNMVYVYKDTAGTTTETSSRRNIFPLAGNDLLSLRLDGRTYAERYALFSDGRGINIRFSRAIDTALQAGDFAISTDTVTITSVSHNANEDNAVIEFDKVPPVGSELRFSDSLRSIMSGTMELAAGNFIAPLYHDEDAPQATGIAFNSRDNSSRLSEWTITFDKPLDPTTIDGNICLNTAYATCLRGNALEDFRANTAEIRSVDHADTEPTTVKVVVFEKVTENTTLTMSFRLNGVRGVDQRPVEEDQVALRDRVRIQDAQSPTITAQWVADTVGTPMSGTLVPVGTNYVIYFRITADESVPTLGDATSYRLQRVIRGGAMEDAGGSVNITELVARRDVVLAYTVPVTGNADAQYFTVVRNGATSLLDAANNQPIDDRNARIADGGIISTDAQATRNTVGAQISVQSATVIPTAKGLKYNLSFEITTTKAIMNIRNTDAYSVNQENSIGMVVMPPMSDLQVQSDDDMRARILYEANFRADQYDNVRGITGWRLDFVPSMLLDIDGNPSTIVTAAAGRTVTRDRANPTITIFGTPAAVRSSDDPIRYEVTFDVRTNENVEGLDQAGSYLLYRDTTSISDSDLMVDIGQGSDNRQTTLTYTVQFRNIMDVRDTTNFRLRRNQATSLLDDSGNLPVDNNGVSIGADAEIDSNAFAARPALSNDRTLSGLQLTQIAGTAINLNKRFDPRATTYTAIVTHDVAQVTVATTATNINATATLNNITLRRVRTNVSLGDSGTITTIAIIVTAEDATTQRYTVAVARQAAPPSVVEPPALTVLALQEGDAIPSPDNGNQYTVEFRVRSTRSVSDIGSTESYVLLHIPTQGNDALDLADLITSSDEEANGDRTESTLTYVVTFTDTNMTTQTAGFTLGRDGTTTLRDETGNDPVKGGMTNNGEAIGDGERIDNDATAVAERDTTPPTITIAASPTAMVRSNNRLIYNVVFVVEANENVRTLDDENSYQLYRTDVDDNTSLVSGVTPDIDDDSDSMRTTLTYVVTFDDIRMLRDTRSFSLRRADNVNALLDDSNNSPVNSNGDFIGTDAEIDPTRRPMPVVSDDSELSNLVLSDTNGKTINLIDFDTDTTGFNPTDLNYNAQIFSGSDQTTVTVIATARDAVGATLALSTDETNFREIESGVTTDVRVTLTAVISIRVTSASGTGIETYEIFLERAAGPTITIATAPTATPRSNPLIYDVVFVAEANENVGTLDDENSYQLYRIVNDTPVPVVSGVTSAISEGSDGMRTTLTYTVTFTDREQVMQTQSFALYRSNDGNSLRDNFQNQPVNSNGDPIGINTEIDSTRRAVRESDGAIITVAVIDRENPGDTSNADNVEALPSNDNGNEYTISFRVENTEHDTKPIADLGTTTSYTIRRVLTADDSNTASNLTIISATGTVNNSGVATLDFVVRIDNQANTELTGGFLLARATDPNALLDRNSNPPRLVDSVINNGTAINEAAVARRDTTQPSLTLSETLAEMPDGNTFDLNFTVTADEAVRGINNGESYYLSFQATQGSASTTTTDVPTFMNVSGNSATLNYSINITNLRTALSISDNTLPYGVELARRGNGLRDLANNDPVQTDAAGSRTDDELADGQPLQLGQVVLLDVVAPSITIAKTDAVADENDVYTMSFTITSSEDVATLAESASYRLVRVLNNNTTASVTTNLPTPTVDTANRQVTISDIRVDLSSLTRAQIRGTRGFTLLRAGENSLIDDAANQPVKADGSTPIADGGFIGPVTSGVIDNSAVALRDSTPPTITVTGVAATVDPANVRRYTGSFVVTSNEALRNTTDTTSYQLMRVLTDDSRELFAGEDDDQGSVSLMLRSTAEATRMTATIDFEATFNDSADVRNIIRSTSGFTLARSSDDDDLIDDASNSSVDVNVALNTAGTAVSAIDKVQPEIGVQARGMATPATGNGNRYTINFDVTSDERIVGIGNTASYVVLRISSDGTVIDDNNLNVVSGERTGGAEDGTNTTLSFVVQHADITGTQMTAGFTLGRAGEDAACNLCDDESNLPQRLGDASGTGTINMNERIDNAPTAVAGRDTVPPSIQVTAATEVTPMVDADGWQFGFKVEGITATDIPSIEAPESYRLLGRDSSNNYAVIETSSFPLTREACATPAANCRVIRADFDIAAAVASNITSFVLGRAPDALRDPSNNDPVVANDTNNPARVVGTGSDGDGRTVLPLDLTGWEYVLNRESPSITVTANDEVGRRVDTITGLFTVSSDDVIDEIRNPASYVLLRVTRSDSSVAAINDAQITVSEQGNDGQTASIGFTVTDNTTDLATLYQYTLGRRANLTDKAGNPLVYAGLNTQVEINEPIDNRGDALADIPDADTSNATVTLEAITGAMPDTANPLVYRGSFKVSSEETIIGINSTQSYTFIRLDGNSDPVSVDVPNVMLSIPMANRLNETTITFVTTLTGIVQVQDTEGFTLIPSSDTALTNESNDRLLNNRFSGDNQVAMREQDNPRLQVTMQTGEQPTFIGGPNRMTAAFRVLSSEAVRGINQAGSYQLLRLEGQNADALTIADPFNGTAEITIGDNTDEGQLVSVAVTLDNIADVRNTYGFTLARSGNLRDLSSNEPRGTAADGTTGTVVTTGGRIDLRTDAIWVRTDRTQPTITVVAQGTDGEEAQPDLANPLVYTGSFRVSSGDVIRNIDSPNAYKLIRRTVGGTLTDIDDGNVDITISDLVGDDTAGYTEATVSYRTTLTDPILTATGDNALEGLVLGNASRDNNGLQDISGNLPVTHVSDSLSPPTALDAISARDRTPPTITVLAQGAGATPNSADPRRYTGSFVVGSSEIIRNIDSSSAYRLLLITLDDDIAVIGASSATLTVSNLQGSAEEGYTTATVSFTANLTEAIVTAVGDDAIRGFTLGTLDDLSGLRGLASNQPILGNQGRLDSADAAIAERERVPPVITVVAQGVEGEEAMPNPNNSLVYTGSFEVTAPDNDPVRNLNNPDVYRLLRIANTESEILATLTITSSAQSDTQPNYYTRAVVGFTTTLTQSVLAETAGFTLGENRIAGFGGLQDISGNRPSTTPPLRRLNTEPESLAARDTTPPQIGIATASSGIAGDATGNYRMSFTVSVENDEVVPTLADTSSYRLVRVIGNGSIADTTEAIDDADVTPNVESSSDTAATISYLVNLSGLTRTERRNTRGFTLVRAAADDLLDRSGNEPVKADGTTVIASGDVLSAVSNNGVISMVATIERDPPMLTVSAQEAVPTEGNGNQYTLRFSVRSTIELVPDLGSTTAYSVVRIPRDGSADVVATVSNSMREDISADGMETTLSYVVTLETVDTTQGTLGFTLVRAGEEADCRLCDISGNAPVAVDARLDGTADAIARRDTTPPSIGIIGTADATGNEGEYTVVFNITANKPIADLGTTSAYVLLQRDSVGTVSDFPSGSIDSSMAQANDDNTTATISYTVSSMDPMLISGFVLGRAGTSLRDASNNDPVDANPEVGDTVENGDALDSRTAAIAVINTPNPRLRVVAEDAMPSVDTPGEYTLRFDVIATDAEGVAVSLPNIVAPESYVLIRIDTDDDETVMAAVPTGVSGNDDTSPTTATVEYTVTFGDITVERATAGFTLGRAPGSLMDNDNDPVMLDGTEIGDNARIDDNEAAVAQRDTQAPSMIVVATQAVPAAGDPRTYTGTFALRSMPTETIRGIGEAGSYRLIRIPTAGNGNPSIVATADNEIDSLSLNTTPGDDATNAIVAFSVTLATLDDARNTAAFTLGRAVLPAGQGLRDLSNNALTPDETSSPFRLDNDAAAEAVRDTTPPTLSVSRARVTRDTGDAYDISFTATRSEVVSGFATTAAYTLLAIATEGATPVAFTSQPTPTVTADENNTDIVTVEYDNVMLTNPPYAFTLGRAGTNLRDLSGNAPVDAGDNTRVVVAGSALDSGDEAVAIVPVPPRLTVEAVGMEAVPSEDNINEYTMSFRVESTEAVDDIGTTESYVLLHIATPGNNAIGDLSSFITSTTSVTNAANTQSVLNYVVTFTDTMTQTRITRGFTLGRNGDDTLQDVDGNNPRKGGTTNNDEAIGDGQRIDDDATAVAERDTAPPQLSITEASSDIAGDATGRYRMNFTVSVDNDEVVPTLADTDSYRLMRVIGDGNSTDTTVAIGNADVMPSVEGSSDTTATISYLADLSGLTRTQRGNTRGFTLVRAGDLLDRSGNEPVQADGTTVIAIGDVLSAVSDGVISVVATIERDAPMLTVSAQEAVPTAGNGNQYTVTFGVSSNELVPDLGSTTAYVVLRVPTDENEAEEVITTVGNPMQEAISDDGMATTLSYVVTLDTVAITQGTLGFTLGRAGVEADCRLCDISGNAPVAVNTRLDDEATAVAERDTMLLSIGIIGTANATENEGEYTVVFNITANKPIADLGTTTAYVLLQRDSVGTVSDFPSGSIDSSMGQANDDNTTATISYTVSSVDPTMISSLGLRSVAGRLRDASNNDPVLDEVFTIIDTTSRRLRVVAEDATPSVDTPGEYTLRFDVMAEDAEGEATSVSDIGTTSSYVLIRINTDDSEEDMVITGVIPTVSANDETNPTTATVEYTVTFGIDEINDERATAGFTLGRAAGRLNGTVRPASAIAIGVDTRIDNNEAAVAQRDTQAPSMIVVATTQAVPATGDPLTYEGTFTVSSMPSEAIRGIVEAGSYRLIRIPTDGTPSIVAVADNEITAVELTPTAGGDATNATVTFSVTLATLADARNTAAFTLGRAELPAGQGLRDLSNNALTPDETSSPFRLDNDAAAEAVRDTTPPTLSVSQARVTRGAGNMYDISFTATRSEAVMGFATTAAYTLLAIATEGATPMLHTPQPAPDNVMVDGSDDNVVTVTYDNVTLTNPPYAFTLGRAGISLLDLSGNAPVDASDNTRAVVAGSALDSGDEAVAIVPVPPRLTVEAVGMEAVPSEDNIDEYTMSFRVESTEAVDDIGTTESYVLLHIATPGNNAIGDLSSFITDTGSETNSANTQSTLSYVVTFTDTMTQTRITRGFTLGRNGDDTLQDGDGNNPRKGGTTNNDEAIGDGQRIDDDATAVAERDTTPPQLSIAEASSGIAGDATGRYRMNFTVSVDNDEVVPTLADTDSYRLVRVIGDGNSTDTAVAIADADVMPSVEGSSDTEATISYLADLSGLTRTQRGNTRGFTLVRAGDLLDRSGNEPVQADGTTAIAIGDVLSAVSDGVISVVATIEREAPTLTVSAQEAVPAEGNGNQYTVRFGVSSNELVPDLGSTEAYVVLRVPTDENEAEEVITTISNPMQEAISDNGMETTLSYVVTLDTVDITQGTLGFTLGRAGVEADCRLCDISGNAPVAVNTRLDDEATAVAERDTMLLSIGIIGTADNTGVANEYRVVFNITANKPIADLGTTTAYVLLQRDSVGTVSDFPSGSIDSSMGQANDDNTTATISYTVSSVDPTMISSLGLRGVAGRLRDASNNDPVLDEVFAIIDTTSPRLRVIAEDAIPSVDRPGQYTLRFDVMAENVEGEAISVSDIGTTASYVLIRINTDENEEDMVITGVIPTVSANDETNPTTATVEYTVTFGIDEINDERATAGFTLGRAAGRLNNTVRPASAIAIGVDTRIDNNEAAVAQRDTQAPSMIVVATTQAVPATGDPLTYEGTFTVSSMPSEAIRGIVEAGSYRLIRIPTDGTPSIVAVADNEITAVELTPTAGGDATNATVAFSVTLATLADARNTAAFTLGRAELPAGQGLRDLSNNALTPDETTSPFRLDNDAAAEAVRDTTPPTIAVSQARVIRGAGTMYDISFVATRSEAVENFATTASYTLLAIATAGATPMPFILQPTPDDVTPVENNANAVTVTYDDVELTDPPYAFTLGRAEDNLQDLSGNEPVDAGDNISVVVAGSALDSRDEAIAIVPVSPMLTVRAVGMEGMEAVPSEGNIDEYTMIFRVESTEAVADIGSTESYVLLHIATQENDAIADLSIFITSTTSEANADNTQSTLSYVVTFTDTMTQTRITSGFTLGRNGADTLQDEDGNNPRKGGTTNNGQAIGTGDRIDDDATALAEIPPLPPEGIRLRIKVFLEGPLQ